MNVSLYFAACSDGVFAIQNEFELTADDRRSGCKLAFSVVNAHSESLAELRAGDSIWLETGIEEIGGKSMTFRHTLFHAPDRETAFTTRFKCVRLHLATRRAAPVPEDVSARAQPFLTATESARRLDMSWTMSLTAPLR